MRTRVLSLVLAAVLLLSLCGPVHGEGTDGTASGPGIIYKDSNPYRNVFMVYMCGDNNLAVSADADIQEMIAAGGSDSNVAVIALLDKPGSADDGIYEITAGGPVRVFAFPGEVNSADPATLSQFLGFVSTNYKADRYILDIWDHGNGFQGVQGVLYDDNPNVHMSIPDLGTTLAGSNMHLDLIAFDACLMDMVEVAYEIRGSGDVLVASEESIPLDGYPYTPILAWLRMNPQEPVAALGSRMVAEYSASYGSSADVTLAAVDLAQVPAVAVALDGLSDVLLSGINTWHPAIKAAMSNTERYPWYTWSRDYGDIVDFTEKLDTKITDPGVQAATAAVRTATTSAVIAQAHPGFHVQNAHGLSVWLAWNRYTSVYTPLKFATDTSWEEFSLALSRQVTMLSPLSVTLGTPSASQAVTLGGTLTATSGTGVDAQTVQLQKWDGSSWTDVPGKIGVTVTSGAYSITWSESVAGTSTYRVHFAGSTGYLGSDSPSTMVTIEKVPTNLGYVTVTPSSPVVLKDFSLSGRLTTLSGYALPGEQVQLQKWDGAAWTDASGKTGVTGSTGAYSITTRESTGGTYRYRIHFSDRALLQATDSVPSEITVQKIVTQLSAPAPSTPTPLINTPFTITGTLTANSAGLAGKTVRFWSSVNGGAAWTDTGRTAQTNLPNGNYAIPVAEVTGGSRTYKVTFEGDAQYAGMASTWITVRINSPPVVSQAYASQKCVLESKTHAFSPNSILGVTDPDGNTLTVKITRITSDEPTATDKQSGGSKYAPDAGITGDNAAIVRAERSTSGNGRVYVMSFTASDGIGGSAQGTAQVCVALKSTPQCSCVDSGQLYDATQVN